MLTYACMVATILSLPQSKTNRKAFYKADIQREVDHMGLANVSLVGNLVKAPELMQFTSGKVKTTLVLAVDNSSKSKEEGAKADFYRVETWGKLAETAHRFLEKGNQVAVSGRLIFDHWTDKSGASRMTPIVEVNQLSLPQKQKSHIDAKQDDSVVESMFQAQKKLTANPQRSTADKDNNRLSS